MWMPAPLKLAMVNPVMTLPPEPAPRIRPSNAWSPPSISTPGSVVPSMVTGTLIVGSADAGAITNGPAPGYRR